MVRLEMQKMCKYSFKKIRTPKQTMVVKQYLKKISKKFNMPGQLSVWPVCLFSVSKPEIGCIKNSHSSSKRCNESRRMSEGGLVMPSSCTAAVYNNNNNSINNNNGKIGNVLPRRKFSFPAVLQSPGLHAELGIVGPSLTVATARRRFSNVSDVVSRKLSHTIGWRTAVPTEQISRQGKALCVQYVRWKLKRAGLYTKKNAGALRYGRTNVDAVAAVDVSEPGYFIPPISGTDGGDQNDGIRREVFPAVLRVGLQLERLDPKLYASGTTTATVVPPPPPQRSSAFRRSAAASATAAVILVSVSRELFRAGAQVTWAKVVSLVCVVAGLAVDCARHGRAEQLPDLIEAFGEVIEDDLAAWIHYNGGWMGLQSYCKPVVVNVENPVFTQIMYLASLLIIIILFLLLLKWFDFIAIFR